MRCFGIFVTDYLAHAARLTNQDFSVKYRLRAEVAEQADALRSGRSSLYGSVGSTPTFGTKTTTITGRGFLLWKHRMS